MIFGILMFIFNCIGALLDFRMYTDTEDKAFLILTFTFLILALLNVLLIVI